MVMAVLIGLVLSVIFAFIQLGVNWRQQYFKSELENERFKSEIAQANLSILKNQLDPHFMFNNFNTLYYLIDEDSELARKFLNNVSTIYRYILQNNDKALISASEEYEMATQYLAVIQQRYTGFFTLEDRTTSKAFDQRDVPPLVLQQLIENAIKHNRIDEDSPLRLSLTTHDGYLTVKNNMNPKRPEVTGKTGLKNIEKRYHYLTGQKVKIQEEAGEFSVSVPLIATHA
jgi:LytS/YehU family sensor histidine kinase